MKELIINNMKNKDPSVPGTNAQSAANSGRYPPGSNGHGAQGEHFKKNTVNYFKSKQ